MTKSHYALSIIFETKMEEEWLTLANTCSSDFLFIYVLLHQDNILFRFQNTLEASEGINTKENVWQEPMRMSSKPYIWCCTNAWKKTLNTSYRWVCVPSNRLLLFSVRETTNQVYLQYIGFFQLFLFTFTHFVVLRIKPIVWRILGTAMPWECIPVLPELWVPECL